jgi:cell wall assembly regulator SMI1
MLVEIPWPRNSIESGKEMSLGRKLLIAIPVLIVVVVVILILAAPYLQRSFFYPKPQGLPPVVDQSTEQLLASLKTVLEIKSPTVTRSLQPGLVDDQILALESQGGFRLSDDLRALYRWHNGMSTNSTDGLLPGHRFVPLDEIVSERSLMRQQVDSASSDQRAAFAVFAGHTKGWIHLFDDGAGDGYFYDPERPESDGAFFYHMAEVGYYVWFPSLRNFLSGTIECYESGAITLATNGEDLDVEYDQTEVIWQRYGKSRDY